MQHFEKISLEDPLSDLKKLQRILFDTSNIPLETIEVVGRLIEGTGSALFFNVNTLISCVEGMRFRSIVEFESKSAVIPDIPSTWQLSRCIYDAAWRFSYIFKEPSLIQARALSFKVDDLSRRVSAWKDVLIEEKNYRQLCDELAQVRSELKSRLKQLKLAKGESDALLKGSWFTPNKKEKGARLLCYSPSFDAMFFVQSSSMIHGGYFLSRYLSAFPNREETWRLLRMPVMTVCSCLSKYLLALRVFPEVETRLRQNGMQDFLSGWASLSEKVWNKF